eukprot:m.231202 g.231202  ORF g.231202 m.231202 type:complete len:149 (-) comp12178_c0_seq1:29-475(-)
MLDDLWLWIFATVMSVSLLFLMVHHLLAFDELTTDHKNPLDVCKTLNPWVLRHYIAHGLLTALFLLTENWILLALNIPLVLFHIFRYSRRPRMLGPGIYDYTEILNRTEVRRNVHESSYKLAFYLASFFYYLYRMMYALLTSEPNRRS